MRFSEAIRLGAALGPQAFKVNRGPGGSLCALFGALEAVRAIGREAHTASVDTLFRVFPVTARPAPVPAEAWPYVLPFYGYGGPPAQMLIGDLVVKLNDGPRWTRERIADWVEEQELRLGMVPPVEQERHEVQEVALAAV